MVQDDFPSLCERLQIGKRQEAYGRSRRERWMGEKKKEW